jgi:hypothetical protein
VLSQQLPKPSRQDIWVVAHVFLNDKPALFGRDAVIGGTITNCRNGTDASEETADNGAPINVDTAGSASLGTKVLWVWALLRLHVSNSTMSHSTGCQ